MFIYLSTIKYYNIIVYSIYNVHQFNYHILKIVCQYTYILINESTCNVDAMVNWYINGVHTPLLQFLDFIGYTDYVLAIDRIK